MTYRQSDFTPRQKVEIFHRDGKRCRMCGCFLRVGRWQADHIQPVGLGGKSTIENGQALCSGCHTIKTRADNRAVKKAVRIAKKEAGVARRSSRPVPGSKGSGTRRKMNGDVHFVDERHET